MLRSRHDRENKILKMNSIRHRLLASTMVGGAALFSMTAISAAAMLAPTAAVAQDYTSGVLSGTVTDASGAAVSGASVAVTSAQGSTRTTTTDANGSFRLPALAVGAYTVRIEQSGFATLNQRASVSPGGASYAFTLTPAGADGASTLEDVIVTAQRVQDFTATDTGLSIDVQEFADRVPAGRSINAVTLFTPGASAPDASINASSRRNQSLVSLSGTSAAESAYYINGMNVTDQRNFLGYGELPFEFIQTIDTKTGGYSAEYGRGTGGVVNIVTRSGTNEWTGGASVYWTPDSLRSERGVSYSPPGTGTHGSEVLNQYASSESKTATVYLGGPLWRDHLFFFGIYEARDSESSGGISFSRAYNPTLPGNIGPRTTGAQAFASSDDPRWAVKLDLVINPNHRVEATFINDENTSESYTTTVNTNLAETTRTGVLYSKSGGETQIFKYTGVFTDWFTLSALYGRQEASFVDSGSPTELPGIRDYGQPGNPWLTEGRHAGPYDVSGRDLRETYRVDADFYFSLFGDHHIRVGYDREDLNSTTEAFYSGGALYYGWSNAYFNAGYCGDPDELVDDGITTAANGCLNITTFGNDGEFSAEQSAYYIQDSWDITPNLTVQLGLRNDLYDYKNIDGQSYIKLDDQWAPRIGFNWDPFGNGVDRVYGSMGDYYLPIALNTSIRASSGEVYTDAYYVAVRNPDGSLQLGPDGRPIQGDLISFDYLSPPDAPDPRSVVEADLKPMYEREFILGYEHRFTDGMFADWSAGVRYVNRELESAIEDTAVGDAVYRYCVRTGDTGCGVLPTTNAGIRAWANNFPYILLNPGDEAVVFLDKQARPRALGDGSANPDYTPETFTLTAADLALPEAERTYEALEFTFERPFDGVWGLQGSYTLANSKGNYEGAVKSDTGQTDTSLTQDYDHRSNTLGAYGYLPNHHRHTIKLFGSYAPSDWFSVGSSFTAQSGRFYGCIGQVPESVDPLAPQGSPPSGWYCPLGAGNAAIPTPRGSQGETDWTYQVDLNFSFNLLRSETRGNLTASVDVFNLFDGDTATRVVEQGWVRNGSNAGADPTQRSNFYGLARSYQSPRSVRFGLRYRF